MRPAPEHGAARPCSPVSRDQLVRSTPKPFAIVAAVDYSPISREVLFEAFRAAADRRLAQVHLIHVQTDVHVVQFAAAADHEGADVPLAPAFQRLLDFSAHLLAEFNEDQRAHGNKPFTNVTAHVRRDAPAEEVAQLAVDLDADLVVIGARGATAARRLMMGSVAHAVLTLALCPVLLVRSKERPKGFAEIQPPCPECIEARRRSLGCDLWCDEHRARHGQRTSYRLETGLRWRGSWILGN